VSPDRLPPPQEVIEQVLTRARAGNDGCVVLVEEKSEVEVRFANNTTTTNGSRRDRRVTVIAVRAVAGSLATGVARRGGMVDVDDLVEAAEAAAAGSPPAPDASPLLEPGTSAPPSRASDSFGAAPVHTDLSVLSEVLSGLSTAFRRAEKGNSVLAGFAEHRYTTEYLATSTGLRAAHSQPEGALQLVARSGDGSASTWAGAGTSDFSDVSVEGLDEQLRTRLDWSTPALARPAGRYEVILPPAAVSDLMIDVLFAAGGRDAEDGQSVFSRAGGGTRVGDLLSAVPFDLYSDPAAPGLECAPFLAVPSSSSDVSVFDNGLRLDHTKWIAGGRLNQLRYHRAGAARSGTAPAGFVGNAILTAPGASASVEDMVSRTERGLLLTCLWYIRSVDPATLLLTGLTRDGVYVIEDGRVVGAANNFRFNESPVDLLARASEVGSSVRTLGREFGEYFNRTRMPPIRIPDFNMSSVSRAS